MIVSTCRPSLKNRILGIERTLKRIAVAWLASMSSFTIFTLPLYLPASWSMIGATMWHGPHQVAQKSTTASPLCCSTSTWKVASVTADGCFTSSITLHAPSINVSFTFYELVRRSHRRRGHEHHRRARFLSRRPGTLARTPGNGRWRHDREPAFRRRRRRAPRAAGSPQPGGEIPCETRAGHPSHLLPRLRSGRDARTLPDCRLPADRPDAPARRRRTAHCVPAPQNNERHSAGAD